MTPEQEIEKLRMANTRLRLEVLMHQEAVKQMGELCNQAMAVAANWQQIAIAAQAKADALERQQ